MSRNHSFKVYFFIGKGGVGKTTCAASFSILLAEKGLKTLIISLDPAHNLGDVLKCSLSDKPKEVMDNLYAVEVDFEKLIVNHLKQLTSKIKDIYGYLRVLNLDRYVDVLKHSPGVEEYAVLDKITEVIKSNIKLGTYDAIVFDTPPTGLTIRVMALPFISAIWIRKLIELRLAILERRRIIERIEGKKLKISIGGKVFELPSTIEEDPIFKELKIMSEDIDLINKVLTNENMSSVYMVINPELLPILEVKRAYDYLKGLGIHVKALVINKFLELRTIPEEFRVKIDEQKRALDLISKLFSDVKITKIPLLPKEPLGIEELRKLTRYLEVLLKE